MIVGEINKHYIFFNVAMCYYIGQSILQLVTCA